MFLERYDAELDATAVALPLHSFMGKTEQFFDPSTNEEAIKALNRAGQLSLVLVKPGSNSAFQVPQKQVLSIQQMCLMTKLEFNF